MRHQIKRMIIFAIGVVILELIEYFALIAHPAQQVAIIIVIAGTTAIALCIDLWIYNKRLEREEAEEKKERKKR